MEKRFTKGDRVRWNDPAIADYEPEDREYAKNRIFEIVSDVVGEEDEIINIVEEDGGTEAEVYACELELVSPAFLNEDSEERVKDALHDYYKLYSEIDRMPVADALEELKAVAENLVDAITDYIYYE